MERFVKFEIHEYMDLHPSINIITFIADSLDEITHQAMEYAKQMNSNYSGGTTRFVEIMSANDARQYLDSEIAKIKHPDDADREWINSVNELYVKCYGEV